MPGKIRAQTEVLNLKDVVTLAQKQSPSYFSAKNQALSGLYSYKVYKAGLLPRITLQSTVTDYSKTIERVQQPDGTYEFRNFQQNFSQLGVNATQNISLTGGTLGLFSSLQRNDVFRPDKRLDYYAIPYSIYYNQPVLLYNSLKWQNRIEPLRLQESTKEFTENMEGVSIDANRLYFNALGAQIDHSIAEVNVANTDTLYKIAVGRYSLGKIAENDLLQMELGFLNAKNQLERRKLGKEAAYQELKRFLGVDIKKDIELSVPVDVPNINVSIEKALAEANSNRPAVLSFRRRRLEAEQNIAEARSQNGLNFNVQANLGQSQQGRILSDVYRNSLPQQNVQVGLNVPLVDWGQARARVKQAKANRDLTEVNVKQEEINFEQEIYLQVMQFNIQNQQLIIAAKADTIAQKRYEVTKQRYLIGKISITDLNLAQNEKDDAKQRYIQSLETYWRSYFTIRRLTLYDFVSGKRISFVVDEK